jgi:hypothetical protein
MSERQGERMYEKWLAIEGSEAAFELTRPLETIGEQGLGVTVSAEAMRFLINNINMFIGTRVMRHWQETALMPQRVVVTVRVEAML